MYIISNHKTDRFVSIQLINGIVTPIWVSGKNVAKVFDTLESALTAEVVLNDFLSNELNEVVEFNSLIPYYSL